MSDRVLVSLLCYDCGSEREGEIIARGEWRCSACYTVRTVPSGHL